MSTVEPGKPASKPASLKARILAGALAAAAATATFTVGWEGDELESYRDIVGVWTVCAGVTGPKAGPGKRYTQAECDALNKRKIVQYLTGIAGCVERELTSNQWVAIGSWTYNVGIKAACGSTLVRQLNAGQPAIVWCKQLLRWDRAGGKVVRGLTRRRQAEYQECVK